MILTTKMWRQFIPIAMAVSLMSALLFFVFSETLRLETNDPQTQIAREVTGALDSGKKPESLITTGTKIDISKSLDTFLIVYDKERKPIVSSAIAENEIPIPPAGVFTFADAKRETRITWEGIKGVRIAAVVSKYNNGYVLVGRSLAVTEERIKAIGLQVLAGWIGTLILVYATVLLVNQKKKIEPNKENEKGA